jgi:Haem-NO-binding
MTCPNFWTISITCSDTTIDSTTGDEALKLHYHSDREGLAPMVVGLVKGLGSRFNTDVEVTQTCSKAEGASHDEFLVKYKPQSVQPQSVQPQ